MKTKKEKIVKCAQCGGALSDKLDEMRWAPPFMPGSAMEPPRNTVVFVYMCRRGGCRNVVIYP